MKAKRQALGAAAGGLAAVYGALFRHAGVWMAAVALLSLLSLVFLLISLVLPWQILAVVDGRAGARWQWLGPDRAVTVLGLAVALAFTLHLLCDWGMRGACRCGVDAVLRRYRKTGLEGAYREQAGKYFTALARSLAALVLWLAVTLGQCLVLPVLALGMHLYLAGWCLAAYWFCFRPPVARRQALAELVRIGGYLGLMFMLGWTVLTYPADAGLRLIWVIVCVIAARQALLQAMQSVLRYCWLWRMRQQVVQFFLPEVVPVTVGAREVSGLQQKLLGLDASSGWLAEVLHAAGGEPSPDGEPLICCRMTERGHAAYLEVLPQASHGQAWLVRLFDAARIAVAEHEFSLLAHAEPGWPMPAMQYQHVGKEQAVAVFDWAKDCAWLASHCRGRELFELRMQLLACSIPDDLIRSYQATHLGLADRWARQLHWENLLINASQPVQRRQIEILQERQQEVSQRLRALPGQVVLPELPQRRMARRPDGSLLVVNWSRWQWAAVGSGWSLRTPMPWVSQALAEAGRRRPELLGISASDVMLAAGAHCLSAQSAGGRYAEALKTALLCLHWLDAEAPSTSTAVPVI